MVEDPPKSISLSFSLSLSVPAARELASFFARLRVVVAGDSLGSPAFFAPLISSYETFGRAKKERERERRDRDIPRIRSLCLCSSWGLAPTKLPPPRIFFIKINALESLSLTKLRVIIRISLGLSLSVGDRQKIVLYEKWRTIVCGERGLIENYKNRETKSRRVSLTKGEASVREEVQKRRGEEERKILCRATVAHFWVSLTVARVALRLLPFHAGQDKMRG